MKAWQKSSVVLLVAFFLLFIGGAKKQAIGLAAIYLVTIPVTYFIERKKPLALWKKRLIIALIVYALFSLLIPLGDIAIFFIASLIFTLLIWISQSFRQEETAGDEYGEDKKDI